MPHTAGNAPCCQSQVPSWDAQIPRVYRHALWNHRKGTTACAALWDPWLELTTNVLVAVASMGLQVPESVDFSDVWVFYTQESGLKVTEHLLKVS